MVLSGCTMEAEMEMGNGYNEASKISRAIKPGLLSRSKGDCLFGNGYMVEPARQFYAHSDHKEIDQVDHVELMKLRFHQDPVLMTYFLLYARYEWCFARSS